MMNRNHQPRDTRGRFSTKSNSESSAQLSSADDATSLSVMSGQLARTAALEPGAASDALQSPSPVVRAAARVIGWDLPERIRRQFSHDEREVLQVVRPDLVA